MLMPLSYWIRPVTGSKRGIPDFIGAVNGFFVALELKLDDARPDPTRETLQKHVLKLMKDAGSPLAVERCTPTTWPEVHKKLMFLISFDRSGFQSLLSESAPCPQA